MKRLDLQLTERAKAWVVEYLSAYGPGSILTLVYGPTRWRFVVINGSQVEQIEASTPFTGEDIYVTNDGVSLCIPEVGDVKRLSGRTLDIVNDAFAVNDRAS
jgi:hypothetical protein